MRKFIVAFDGLKYSKSARDHAIALAKKCEAHLVGIILNDITHHSFRIYDLVTSEGGVSIAKQNQLLRKDEALRQSAAEDFKVHCEKAGLEYTLHYNRCIATQELLHEAVYADLLIIDKNENFTFQKDRPPTNFIKDILPEVECPVLIVPHQYFTIDQAIMLYDGEPSSVFAIKMFNYTLPCIDQHPELITVKTSEEDTHLPDNKLIKELMKRHYKDVKYTILKGSAPNEIIKYAKTTEPSSVIVLGAYRRHALSRWFRRSMADILMKEMRNPLFIAHT